MNSYQFRSAIVAIIVGVLLVGGIFGVIVYSQERQETESGICIDY